jgi:CBS domain-containing protein
MAISSAELKEETIELATESFETFCEDISGMFGIEMACEQGEPASETVKSLSKKYKKLAAVNLIKAEGPLAGDFMLVFDKEGLFTLAGVIVMLPEQRITQNRKSGTAKDAEEAGDALGEAGNLLVGSWDRIFRESLEDHGHFKQTDTVIGNPWMNSEEKINVSSDEELLHIPFQMTIGEYPAFNCGVIFPESIFGGAAAPAAEPAPAPAAEPEATPEPAASAPEPAPAAPEPVAEATPEPEPAPAPEPVAEATPEPAAEPEPTPAEPEPTPEPVATEPEPAPVEPEPAPEPEPEPVAAEPEPTPAEPEPVAAEPEPAAEPKPEPALTASVAESIQQITQSPADLPGQPISEALKITAHEIMQSQLLWGGAEDSVDQVITKMQQSDAGYMLVGTEDALEGIVSSFDIASTISIYLKPMFAKWRRPVDDATLKIRVKWVMTRLVKTIKMQTSLAEIMQYMSQSSINCLPVTDDQGKVVGIVTTFDIFRAISGSKTGSDLAGKPSQAPALV